MLAIDPASLILGMTLGALLMGALSITAFKWYERG